MTVLCRSLAALILVAVASACTFPPLATPSPSPSRSPTPGPTPSSTPTSSPTPSPEPTPDLGDVPIFAGAELVATAIDGLRIRQRPGLSSVVIAGLLPVGSELEILMGPMPLDGVGWYLVADADPAEPSFEEGWIAAGFEPDAFLRATGRSVEDTSVVASHALDGDAEYGPITIADDRHVIRWAAVDPERRRCTFAVLLAPADGEPISAIRATVGSDLVPGTLQPTFFAAQPELRGQVFLTVQSDCAWSLVVIRVPPPDDEASPTASPDDG
ncbi:MAG TPA: SH3 domain-containing protein [Candidatus Angelobacter sp.]|nr:SH3 domain-containing protein [Candidatus Angelobacter sp.]